MIETGVKIGAKHTYRDWGLIWTGTEIGAPEPQLTLVEVPGRDGSLDLTEAISGDLVRYKNRQLRLHFTAHDKSRENWHLTDSKIRNYCHGKRMEVFLDSDKSYFWIGRIAVETTKEAPYHSDFVISVDAEPHKYNAVVTGSLWLWDPFNFTTDSVRDYDNITVSGTKTVTLVGYDTPVSPTIECSAAMTLTAGGKTFSLTKGKNSNSGILIYPGENAFRFTGNGTVSISYKGMSL